MDIIILFGCHGMNIDRINKNTYIFKLSSKYIFKLIPTTNRYDEIRFVIGSSNDWLIIYIYITCYR